MATPMVCQMALSKVWHSVSQLVAESQWATLMAIGKVESLVLVTGVLTRMEIR